MSDGTRNMDARDLAVVEKLRDEAAVLHAEIVDAFGVDPAPMPAGLAGRELCTAWGARCDIARALLVLLADGDAALLKFALDCCSDPGPALLLRLAWISLTSPYRRNDWPAGL